ncbi:MAG: aldo/keto reductase [Planctomycetota bacterium]
MKTLTTYNGLEIPAVGLGTWEIPPETAASAVETAIESGYRHIDGAMIYLNEQWVGEGIEKAIGRGLAGRDDLWVTSKLWNDSHRAEHVRPAIEKTLSDLRLDYLDLYLIHWPVVHQHGVIRPESGDQFVSLEEVPLWETWQAMEEICAAGLCRSIGVSNCSARKIDGILENAKVKPVVNQVESHPYHQQKTLKDYCDRNGILMTAYSPLGSGGRPQRLLKNDEPSLFENEVLKELAAARGCTTAQIMIAWAVCRGSLTIPKSSNPQRQRENLEAMNIDLADDELGKIADLERGYRFIDGTFWEMEGGPYTVANLWDE